MSSHADQCFKHSSRNGWTSSYTSVSTAICLNEAGCKSLCNEEPTCQVVETETTLDRCFLNTAECASATNRAASSAFDVLVKALLRSKMICLLLQRPERMLLQCSHTVFLLLQEGHGTFRHRSKTLILQEPQIVAVMLPNVCFSRNVSTVFPLFQWHSRGASFGFKTYL